MAHSTLECSPAHLPPPLLPPLAVSPAHAPAAPMAHASGIRRLPARIRRTPSLPLLPGTLVPIILPLAPLSHSPPLSGSSEPRRTGARRREPPQPSTTVRRSEASSSCASSSSSPTRSATSQDAVKSTPASISLVGRRRCLDLDPPLSLYPGLPESTASSAVSSRSHVTLPLSPPSPLAPLAARARRGRS